MTLGWLATSGRGASVKFEASGETLVVGCWLFVAGEAVVAGGGLLVVG